MRTEMYGVDSVEGAAMYIIIFRKPDGTECYLGHSGQLIQNRLFARRMVRSEAEFSIKWLSGGTSIPRPDINQELIDTLEVEKEDS